MDAATKGILDLLIEGNSRGNIAEVLQAQGVADPAAAIAVAIAELEAAVTIPRDLRRAWCLEAYREVYRRLLKTGDYAGASKAIKDYAALAELPRTAAPAARSEPERIAAAANPLQLEPAAPDVLDVELAQLISMPLVAARRSR